jgi:putative transposase
MRKSSFSEAQIIGILHQVEKGFGLPNVCRQNGINSATFYKWRSKHSGMDASMIADMNIMQDETQWLLHVT